ncbi:putative transcription factor Trihelix family [Helianthus anomalus]
MTNNHHTSRHHSGGREDYLTESETETLIESWGDRFLQLSLGSLRQKDWKDVADAINANHDLLKIPRTDVLESKTMSSKWPFFTRLGDLIGTGGSVTQQKINTPKTAVVSVTVKSGSNPNPDVKGVVYSGGSDNESVGRMESLDDSDGMMAYKELARAFFRFREVYERMENLKQEEMVKLEK